VTKCKSKIWEARKKGKRVNKRLATDLGERTRNKVRSNLPEWSNTMFMVVIRQGSNGNHIILSPNQLQALDTGVRHWEELIGFITKNGLSKEPYMLTSRFQ